MAIKGEIDSTQMKPYFETDLNSSREWASTPHLSPLPVLKRNYYSSTIAWSLNRLSDFYDERNLISVVSQSKVTDFCSTTVSPNRHLL